MEAIGALALVDVLSGGIPARESPILVAQRVIANQNPAVLIVRPAHPLLGFERHAEGKRPGAFVAQSVDVVGVIEPGAKLRSHHVLHRDARELKASPVDI
jgi:hypothetical protein